MQYKAWLSGQSAARKIAAHMRQPEIMVFVPALSLVAFWLGGSQALVITAIATPMFLMLAGAIDLTNTGQEPSLGQRAQIVAVLERAMREAPLTGRSTACLVLQFDEMDKLVNRHGRAAQAAVLAQTAERWVAMVREGDVVVQIEGGGFAVALAPVQRLDLEAVIQMAARLQGALAIPFSVDAARIYATVSVGFCLSARAPKQSGLALLEAAQIAADEAARHGPGAIRVFSAEMARISADRDAQREELELALDEGQIRTYFQPQISTDTGTITGFEALARWHHPERGLIPPSEFLPKIEAAGLSERLGEVMLFNALSALTVWDKAGFNVPRVSVNFSCAELRNPKLVDKLKWELDRFDMQSTRLCVEILETVVAYTADDVIVANLAALASLGCQIDLDDFGTGHASITSIRRFPLRRLKIDRSFVTRVDADREQQKMVSAILSMAEQLGLETLAEGVETPAEHSMLAQLGCNEVQGFGIGRPMPLAESSEWITRHISRKTTFPRIGGRIRQGPAPR